MNRNSHKKQTFEDRFARKYYCNSHRFMKKIKKANNKKFRRENVGYMGEQIEKAHI